MKDGAFAAHRSAASGLFTLFTLFAIVLGLGDPRPLALAMGGALLSLFALTRPGIDVALDPTQVLALRFVLSALLTELSYHFIEEPVRSGRWLSSLRRQLRVDSWRKCLTNDQSA